MHRVVLVLSCLSAACAGPVPNTSVLPPVPAPVDWTSPGQIRHEAVVSAKWSVALSGLVNLKHPEAAGLEDKDQDIVLPVHVLTHPEQGLWVVDTGVPTGSLPVRGLMRVYADGIEAVEPLAAILARQSVPLAGVLLTHNHLDHILGLPDVPAQAEVYAGQGEEHASGLTRAFMFPTFARLMGDRNLRTWDFAGERVVSLEGVPAIDVFGDGQLYALDAHGHTKGSTAYLARTTEGPVLFTGDCSHTIWGWNHDVTPGAYTEDLEENAESLHALRSLVEGHPEIRVEVGHDLQALGWTADP